MTASPIDDNASAEHRIRELTKELLEAREQQAATADILRVISSSPTDLQHVFAMIAASVARLCGAHDATIFQIDSGALRVVAHHGPIEEFAVGHSRPLVAGHVNGRAALERRPIQVADLQAEEAEYPEGSKMAPWPPHHPGHPSNARRRGNFSAPTLFSAKSNG